MRPESPYHRSILSAIEGLTESVLAGENVDGLVGMSVAYRVVLESTIIPWQHCNSVLERLQRCVTTIETRRTGPAVQQILRNLKEASTAVEQQYRSYSKPDMQAA